MKYSEVDKINKQFRSMIRHLPGRQMTTVLAVLVFGMVGTILLTGSHAQTPTASFEVENGTLATCAASVADSSASKAHAVKFAACSSASFVHPGIFIGTDQINFVRTKVQAGTAPWSTFYTQMQSTKDTLGTENGVAFGSLSYVAHPGDNVTCPSGNSASAPNLCNDELMDPTAAYAATLEYLYGNTNRDAYAQQAINIINSWSAVFRNRVYVAGDSSTSNAYLQASWAGAMFAKTAELIRYTYTPPAGEASLNITNLNAMFNSAYIPYVDQVWNGGGANWVMSFDEAAMDIGIFMDDQSMYNSAVERWKGDVPSVIYMSGDSNPYSQLQGSPIPTPGTMYDKSTTTAATMNTYWYSPSSYISGLEGETCRDAAHMSMGFGPMVDVAETARLQGQDLYNYNDFKTRITTGLELNTGYIKSFMDGASPSDWPCPSAMTPASTYGWQATFETAYNAYANRLGVPLPNTNALLTSYARSSSTKVNHEMAWEGLTSYGTP